MAATLSGLLLAGVSLLPGLAWGYEEAAVTDGGSLIGSVKFVGPAPKLDPIPVKKNRDVCGQSVVNEALVVGPNRGVKGSVILVEGVTRGKRANNALTLDNAKCLFVPHVAAVMAGATVKVKNSDDVLHNSHGYLGTPTVFNLALPNRGQVIDITKRLKKPGAIKVLCDAHTHMSGWIVVHDSPYYAVTDENGDFKIDDIPPGKYTVTMWHEGFILKSSDKDGRPVYDEPRRVVKHVVVPAKGSATVDFELK
jgi:plastocyanin